MKMWAEVDLQEGSGDLLLLWGGHQEIEVKAD
jgi:hypothetical protein